MFCYNCVILGRNNTNDSHRTHAVEETCSAILRVKLCNSVIQDGLGLFITHDEGKFCSECA